MVAAALIVAAFAAPWGSRMVDLEVYRVGASALLDGQGHLYGVGADIWPGVHLPGLRGGGVRSVCGGLDAGGPGRDIGLSLVALWAIVHLTVLAVRSAVGAVRGSALAWSVPLSVVAVASHPVLETLLFGQINLILTALVLADVLAR